MSSLSGQIFTASCLVWSCLRSRLWHHHFLTCMWYISCSDSSHYHLYYGHHQDSYDSDHHLFLIQWFRPPPVPHSMIPTTTCSSFNDSDHHLFLIQWFRPPPVPHSMIPTTNRLVGLVVKASASRAEDPGFESLLCRDFFGVVKIGTPVATLACCWDVKQPTNKQTNPTTTCSSFNDPDHQLFIIFLFCFVLFLLFFFFCVPELYLWG